MMRRGMLIVTLCLVGLTLAKPDAQQVQEALKRASQINTLRRGIDQLYTRELSSAGGQTSCPLARFHGARGEAKDEMDTRTNDAITAAQLLLKEGFTTVDLQSETVSRELTRQLVNCPTDTITCNTASRYRSADGSCNNLANPTWGKAGTAQKRDLASEYGDSISNPRSLGVGGQTLPNPRTISNNVHVPGDGRELRSSTITLQTFQMGQFLDHDLIKTPVVSSPTNCCGSTDVNNCLPINVEANDPNPNFNEGYCMNFHRSSPLFCGNKREQINELTSYIDASNVYGSSDVETAALRDGSTPFLLVADGNRLPDNPNQNTCIANETAGFKCALAGDGRVNVVPSLITYHTMFVREHNRIAQILQGSFPDNDVVFQETRKIVIGVMQKIIYDEFLPAFVSQDAVRRYRLSSDEQYQYDNTLDATISNGFGIAYRMGHTWIPREMSLFDQSFRRFRLIETDTTFLRPDVTYFPGPPQGMDGLAFWLSGANSPETDRIVEDVARSRLFLSGTDSFDLAALNIQRARDHGIPSFTKYRTACGLGDLTSWNSIPDAVFAPGTRRRLRDAGYQSPQDIDLFTGLIAEAPVSGGTLGATAECMLGRQFRALKYGDRFWYQGEAARFNTDQQREIQRHSLSKILCDNFNFREVQTPNAFLAGNSRRLCRDINGMNLDLFRGGGGGGGGGDGGGGQQPPPPRPRPRSQEIKTILDTLIHDLEEAEKTEG